MKCLSRLVFLHLLFSLVICHRMVDFSEKRKVKAVEFVGVLTLRYDHENQAIDFVSYQYPNHMDTQLDLCFIDPPTNVAVVFSSSDQFIGGIVAEGMMLLLDDTHYLFSTSRDVSVVVIDGRFYLPNSLSHQVKDDHFQDLVAKIDVIQLECREKS